MPEASAPTNEPERALRASRLEALCVLALEAAGVVEVEALWDAVGRRLGAVLAPACAILRFAEEEEHDRVWTEDAAGEGIVSAVGEALDGAPGWSATPEGVAVLVLPLHRSGASLGTLGVGWTAPVAEPEELRSIAELLAAHVAAGIAGVRAHDLITEVAYRRERFFSAMSHDLRTPITAIVGYSELLADGIAGDLSRQQQDMVDRISQVSGHLAQLVNDVLDLARLDAGRMEFHSQPSRLGELVEEALPAVEPQARAKGLDLTLALGDAERTAVLADPGRARQILVNLLSNAVKFTADGGVTIGAGSDADRAWIDIRDTGPGLPPASEEAVFEEFLQLASGTRSKGEPGSGLGLAISRRLARAMGGDLTARNLEGAGAEFTLVLPRSGEA
jgi:signal transduction histidine kinase